MGTEKEKELISEKYIWVCKKHGMLEVSETGITTAKCKKCIE